MTIVVGIRCADGIVIAADQQATRGSAVQPTIGSPVIKITEIKEGKALFAFSGWTGLGQQIGAAIEAAIVLNKAYMTQARGLSNAACGAIHPAFERYHKAKDIIPGAASEAICGCLLAAGFSDGHHLLEITPQGNFDLADPMKWACVGSGIANADSFLSFIWGVFWQERDPTLSEAVITAYWAVSNAIESKAPLVGFEVDVFTLSPNEAGAFVTRKLTREELAESNVFIERAKASMRAFRDEQIPTPQTEAQDKADAPPIPTDLGAAEQA